MKYRDISYGGFDLYSQAWWPDFKLSDFERARRGDNVEVPFRTGRVPVEGKPLDQLEFELRLHVTGRNPTSGAGPETETQLQQNLDQLLEALAKDGFNELRIELPDGSVRVAQAEVVQVEHRRVGVTTYAMLVVFRLADPFFYAETVTTSSMNVTSLPQNMGLANDGSYWALPVVRITGGLTDPIITIDNGAGQKTEVSWVGTVPDGQIMEIDCVNWTAKIGTVDYGGELVNQGAREWLRVPAGTSTLTVDGAGGLTTNTKVEVEFTERWL